MRGTRGWINQTLMADGRVQERDAFRCGHCQRLVTVKPMCDPADMGGRCFCCDSLICKGCVGKGCTPLEMRLEAEENRARFQREMRG